MNLLRSLSDQTHVQQPSSPHATSAPDNSKQDGSRSQTPLLSENVRATFRSSTPYRCRSGKTSPAHPLGGNSPRRSTEYSRSSFEVSRRSAEIQRERLQIEVGLDRHSTDISRDNPASPQYSADSFVQSFNSNAMSDSDAYRLSSDEESASQILSGSGVFKSPTFKNRRSSSKTKKHNRNESSGSAVSQQQKAPKHIVVHPSSQSNVGTLSMSKKQIGLGSDSDMEKSSAEKGKKSPSLQDILKTGGAPLQRAAGWADWMKQHSKKILASDPMSYIEKVSDMWSGGTKHFGQPMGAMPNEQVDDEEDEYENDLGPEERFRAHFPSCKSDKLNAVYFGYIQRVLPLYGKIYISERHFCFRSIVPGTRTKVRQSKFPLKPNFKLLTQKPFRLFYHSRTSKTLTKRKGSDLDTPV